MPRPAKQPTTLYGVVYVDRFGNETPKDYMVRDLTSARKLVRGLNATEFVKRVKIGRYAVRAVGV